MNIPIYGNNMSGVKRRLWGRYNQSSVLCHYVYWRDWLTVEETLALHSIFAHLKERTPQKKQINFISTTHPVFPFPQEQKLTSAIKAKDKS